MADTSRRSILSLGGGIYLGFAAAASILIGISLWLWTGEVAPLRDVELFDVVLYIRPIREIVWWTLASFATIVGLRLVLSPLFLFALPPVAYLLVATGHHRWATPWLYLFVDMRWVFVAAVGVIELAALDARAGGRWRALASSVIERVSTGKVWRGRLVAALILLLTAFSWASSPHLRFQSLVIGDEPKYLRFVENWYRGQGLDISHFPPLRELPDDSPHLLRNIAHLATATGTVGRALVTDAIRIVNGGEAANQATAAGNWSVRGVHGGLYQGHHPGSALVLLPGYFIDRYFLNWTNVYQEQFPTDLYATNASMFIVYLLWAIALYQLLTAYTEHHLVAFALVAVGMMSLPATAFSYQYYPEAAGGFVITLVAYYAIFSQDERRLMALGCGALAGFLPLLHPRWGPAAVVVALTVAASARRRSPSLVAWFLGGFVALMMCFALYMYYITGSMLPWTMYDVEPEAGGLSIQRALRDLPKLWLDWRWGLIAHAPVYLLALPGLLLFMRRRAVAVPIGLILLLTAALAATHRWAGSGTTPCRLIAAVVPLLLLPMGDAVVALRRSRVFVAAAALLAAISVHNGYFYNRFFDRSDTAFNAASSVSGWKSPLLFVRPDEGAHVDILLVFWIALCVLGIALPLMLKRTSGTKRILPHKLPLTWAPAIAVVLLVFAATASAIDAYSGSVVGWRFLDDQRLVESRLARAYLQAPDGLALSALRGKTDIAAVARHAPEPGIALHPTLLTNRRDVDLRIEVTPGSDASVWGRASIDFGDRTPVQTLALVGNASTAHRYAAPGEYTIGLQLVRPGAAPTHATTVVRVEDERIPADVPNPFARYPRSIVVRQVLVGAEQVEVRCSLPDAVNNEHMQWWAWLGTEQNGNRGGAMYVARRSSTGNGSEQTLVFNIQPRPPAGELVRLSVGAQAAAPGAGGSSARSAVSSMHWPADRLTIGAPVSVEAAMPR